MLVHFGIIALAGFAWGRYAAKKQISLSATFVIGIFIGLVLNILLNW